MKKRRTKKIFFLLISLFLLSVFGLSGCGKEETKDIVSEAGEQVADKKIEESLSGTKLLFEVPKSFVIDEAVQGLYYSDEYAEDMACIYYQEKETDEKFSLLTEDTIEELMQEAYFQMYGIETTVDVSDFHRFNLDGYEAYRLETEFEVNEAVLSVIEYIVVVGDRQCSLTYMQKQNAGWEAAFTYSAENIEIRE